MAISPFSCFTFLSEITVGLPARDGRIDGLETLQRQTHERKEGWHTFLKYKTNPAFSFSSLSFYFI